MTFNDFYYLRIPQPIATCGRFSRFEATVFGVIFTAQKMKKGQPVSVPTREISRRIGAVENRSNVRTALRKLNEEEVLIQLDDGRWQTNVPDWIRDSFDDFVRDSSKEDWNEGGVERTQGDGSSGPLKGGRADPPRVIPRNGNRNLIQTRDSSAVAPQEILEPDPDGDAPSTVAEQEEAVVKRKAVNEKKAHHPRRKVAAKPGDEEFLREPSKREVFNGWRRKRGAWAARDVIGYFVCRFKEISGREPPEFFGTTEGILKTVVPNVRKYTERWLEGDYARAKHLVDRILERAEPRGMPAKLAFFFLPRTEAPALRLEEPVRGKAQTPAERNDARGKYEGNEEYWDERVRKSHEKQEARERRRAERDAS